MDPRQVVGAFLTLSMFAMLGNMIKRDHFDSVEAQLPDVSGVHFKVMKVEEKDVDILPRASKGPWKESSGYLKPCWTRPEKEAVGSNGYITFSLTGGPEYHVSQVADVVAIARYLGATLMLPDIRGSELGQKRNFEDIYSADKFMRSLDGIIKIARVLPSEIATGKPAVVRVPYRVTEDYIAKNIEPIFRVKHNLRLAIVFPSIDLKVRETQRNELVSVSCAAMFDALELKPEYQEVANMMVERLKSFSQKSDSHFIAVDLRVDILEKKECRESGTPRKRSCYGAQEVGEFLRNIGFDRDTTVYLTQTWWHESLNILKESFPKTYTKDDVLPSSKKGDFLKSGNAELQKALDFYICSQSDVFVPAISGMFYGNVAGKRIASGRNQILVPSQVPGHSTSSADYISPYISKKNHLAYSCYC